MSDDALRRLYEALPPSVSYGEVIGPPGWQERLLGQVEQAGMSKVIALDFDGVVHFDRSPFAGADIIPDEPVPGALDFIRQAYDEGFEVVIHTARANAREREPDRDVDGAILDWLAKHGLEPIYLERLVVTHKKIGALVYLDDKGMRFEGRFPTFDELRKLKCWHHDKPISEWETTLVDAALKEERRPWRVAFSLDLTEESETLIAAARSDISRKAFLEWAGGLFDEAHALVVAADPKDDDTSPAWRDAVRALAVPHDPRGRCSRGCGRKAIDGKATCGELRCEKYADKAWSTSIVVAELPTGCRSPEGKTEERRYLLTVELLRLYDQAMAGGAKALSVNIVLPEKGR